MTFDLTNKEFSANCINAPNKDRDQYLCQKLRNALEIYTEHLPWFNDFRSSDDCDFSKFPTNEVLADTDNVSITIIVFKFSI